jgi:hypothetical protein
MTPLKDRASLTGKTGIAGVCRHTNLPSNTGIITHPSRLPNTKFYKNPPNGFGADEQGRTDRQTDRQTDNIALCSSSLHLGASDDRASKDADTLMLDYVVTDCGLS